MTRPRTTYRCEACGHISSRWSGRCPACGEWNTVVEVLAPRVGEAGGSYRGPRPRAPFPEGPNATPLLLSSISSDAAAPGPTGVGELDRVLGGGLVAGSVTLLGGEPGVGKSTLVLQALGRLAEAGARCLLVGAEES